MEIMGKKRQICVVCRFREVSGEQHVYSQLIGEIGEIQQRKEGAVESLPNSGPRLEISQNSTVLFPTSGYYMSE